MPPWQSRSHKCIIKRRWSHSPPEACLLPVWIIAVLVVVPPSFTLPVSMLSDRILIQTSSHVAYCVCHVHRVCACTICKGDPPSAVEQRPYLDAPDSGAAFFAHLDPFS
mmetsp:Transcript_16373/g.28645  ORF Transcript_16373/g.28645 Transcript_16373/m.28645 type:complete len:109 (-) Transcript_16373:328-654(-)